MMRKRTTVAKPADTTRQWYVVDAAGVPLGRLSTKVASLLSGKHKVDYTPHVDAGEHVIVINAEQIKITGRKGKQKVYYSHSGYPGNLREESLEHRMERNPKKVVEKSVYGMIAKNKLRPARMERLKIYVGSDHKHEAQKPQEIKV